MDKTKLLEQLFNQSINTVDKNLNIKDFAISVAGILENNYGDHNYVTFMKTMQKELFIRLENEYNK
jgi:hypothetical protein